MKLMAVMIASLCLIATSWAQDEHAQGWTNGMSAVAVGKDVFANRKIGVDQLPSASPALLPLNKDAEAGRAAAVEQQFGKVAPGLVQYTTAVLFRDLWLRPDLAPRDRS